MEESESDKNSNKKELFTKRDFNNQYHLLVKEKIPQEHHGKTISWLKNNGFEKIVTNIRKELVSYVPSGLKFSSCWSDLHKSVNQKRYSIKSKLKKQKKRFRI